MTKVSTAMTTVPSGKAQFAKAWAQKVLNTSYVAMNWAELTAFFEDITSQLIRAANAQSPSIAAAAIGKYLVDRHFTGPSTLEESVRFLDEQLTALLENELGTSDTDIAGRLQAGFAAGFAQALRNRALLEQERILYASTQTVRETQARLQESEVRFRAIFDEAAVGICIVGADGELKMANEALAKMFGMTSMVFQERLEGVLRSPRNDDPDLWSAYHALLHGELDQFQVERNYRLINGGNIWVKIIVSLVRRLDDSPQYLVCFIEDVSQRHELEQRLRRQATYDAITQLPNRSLLFERIDEAICTAHPDSKIGLCTIDIDQFKAVNDTLGHEAGDELLIKLAGRLEAHALQRGHFIAHVGADEFTILIKNCRGEDELRELAEALLTTVAEPIPVKGLDYPVSVTIGATERPATDLRPSELVGDADLTLSWAKKHAAGRWVLGDAERNAKALDRYALSTAMPAALAREEFFVEYQPLVCLSSNTVLGAEALVRWQHPERNRISPDIFVHLAEETGVIVDLGRWVLERACEQARKWQDEFGAAAPFISVNLAVRQLRHETILPDIREVLDRTGLDPHKLQLELTESAIMGPTDASLEKLRALADMGIKLAIDDFGTGYSNLAYLKRLPVGALKLDGSFVAGLQCPNEPGAADNEIVTSVIRLAHSLGLSVTAEGIETAGQADLLCEAGCDLGQGWLFAKSITANQIADMVRFGTVFSRRNSLAK